jgi:Fe-S-cluster containining protein
MENLPCKGCKGLCCGPVPVTKQELLTIKRKIKSMPLKKRLALQNQPRYSGTCIFYDMDLDQCGIHTARPAVCRAFGHYANLICFRKPEIASSKTWISPETHVGLLTVDFIWKDFK